MNDTTTVTIDHVDTDTLHPLYTQYAGQVTAQPSYVEFDLDSGNLGADYSSAVGGGVPVRVWNEEVLRFDIDPQLTASEINALLDKVAPIAKNLLIAYSLSDVLDHRVKSQRDRVEDYKFEISQICEKERTISGGVWSAEDWIGDLNHDDNILRHDSTDEDIAKIAEDFRDLAEDDLVTLENVSEYLIAQRDILRTS